MLQTRKTAVPPMSEAPSYFRFETLPLADIAVPPNRMRALHEDVVDQLVE